MKDTHNPLLNAVFKDLNSGVFTVGSIALRDIFAAFIIGGMWATPVDEEDQAYFTYEHMARDAYLQADEMLKARIRSFES